LDLAVVPVKVVDEDRHRGQAVERGMWSPVIVGPQPSGESLTTLVVGAVQPPIGPLIEQGLVTALVEDDRDAAKRARRAAARLVGAEPLR
jgi:hypothetical protein